MHAMIEGHPHRVPPDSIHCQPQGVAMYGKRGNLWRGRRPAAGPRDDRLDGPTVRRAKGNAGVRRGSPTPPEYPTGGLPRPPFARASWACLLSEPTPKEGDLQSGLVRRPFGCPETRAQQDHRDPASGWETPGGGTTDTARVQHEPRGSAAGPLKAPLRLRGARLRPSLFRVPARTEPRPPEIPPSFNLALRTSDQAA